jgi:hypothetical protein
MWPPGSLRLAVRTPQGRSIGPLSSSPPRAANDLDGEHIARSGLATCHRCRLDELSRRCGRQQVDDRVPEVEHGRVVVLERNRQADDLPIEPLRGLQLLEEQRYGTNALRLGTPFRTPSRSFIHERVSFCLHCVLVVVLLTGDTPAGLPRGAQP